MNSEKRVINSALWSAYGDALGFISELADEGILKKRVGHNRVVKLQEWKRLIGGFNGAEVSFPSGTYSDDTQLRLAISRCINNAGYFDVEAFAKIELTVWLSYCLGAGRGTKFAASNLAKADVNWFSNFYNVNKANYFDSGGNGVIMRVQPHIWCALDISDRGLLLDVFKNSICTHGHLRALIGASFHALFLLDTFKNNSIPSIENWRSICSRLRVLSEVALEDMQIATFWIPMWEESTKLSFPDAISDVINEMHDDISILLNIFNGSKSREEKYISALTQLGGFDESQRGSGTKTAVLSSFLSILFPYDPKEALVLCANCLGSDTDTIATVAGAVLGVVNEQPPPERLQDQNYIEKESMRLYCVSHGNSEYEFSYPDLYSWRAPKVLTESLVKSEDGVAIIGLGRARIIGKNEILGKNSKLQWIWTQTAFGQSFLIRYRDDLKLAQSLSIGGGYIDKNISSPKGGRAIQSVEKSVAVDKSNSSRDFIDKQKSLNLNQDMSIETLLDITIKNNFDPLVIGRNVLKLIGGGRPVEDVVSYIAMVTHAKRK